MENLRGRKSTLSGLHIPVPTFPLSTPPGKPIRFFPKFLKFEPILAQIWGNFEKQQQHQKQKQTHCRGVFYRVAYEFFCFVLFCFVLELSEVTKQL